MEFHLVQFADEHTQWAPAFGLRQGGPTGPWVMNRTERLMLTIEGATRWVASEHARLKELPRQQGDPIHEAVLVFTTGVRV